MSAPERELVEAPAGTRLTDAPGCKLCSLPDPARREIEAALYCAIKGVPDATGKVPTRADIIRQAPARWDVVLNGTNLARHAGLAAWEGKGHWTPDAEDELAAANRQEAEDIQRALATGELPSVSPERFLRSIVAMAQAEMLRAPGKASPFLKLGIAAAAELRLQGHDESMSALLGSLVGATAAALGATVAGAPEAPSLPAPGVVDGEAVEVPADA